MAEELYSVADYSPTLKRTNRAIEMFSPSFAIAAWTVWPIVTLGSRIDGCSSLP